MATYFHGAPEIQADGLQTLYLMNPNYVGYSDTAAAAAPASMVLLNSTMNSLNPMNHHPHQQQQQHHFVGIPLQPTVGSHDSNRPQPIQAPHDVQAIHGLVPRLHCNLWTSPAAPTSSVDVASQFGPRRPSTMPQPQQGLSLSLSPREMVAPAPEMAPASAEEAKILGSSSSASGASGGVPVLQSFLMGSKYLKAAQQLLDEVVNVGQGIKGDPAKGTNSKSPMKGSRESEGTGAGTAEEDACTKRGADLTTAERQELQMKKAKLVSMLDEVEQRYRQYHHQMQIVVASFEAVAGVGSARTYTALALRTISKQFRCLRDAIAGQIRATSGSLGEEETKSGGSRLRFVDHHLRQQRALQQLGMIQHNAWRPQRGLPERSVSILRAWLFEHFLHPYPKDSDKIMLSKQTGLTRSQVSNWFINARVRLWKPMVEEMYLEETKDQEQNNTDHKKASKSEPNENSASKSSANQESSPARTAAPADGLKTAQDQPNDLKTSSVAMPPSSLGNDRGHASYYENEATVQPRLKKARSSDGSLQPNAAPPHSIGFNMKSDETSNRELLMKFMDGQQSQGFSLMAGSTGHGGSFGAYPMADLGRFESEQFTPRFSGNGVSLTLGLPHCENLSLSGAQPSFLSTESMPSFNNNPSVAHPPNAYESIDMQSRKRFAAQLLPDFVA